MCDMDQLYLYNLCASMAFLQAGILCYITLISIENMLYSLRVNSRIYLTAHPSFLDDVNILPLKCCCFLSITNTHLVVLPVLVHHVHTVLHLWLWQTQTLVDHCICLYLQGWLARWWRWGREISHKKSRCMFYLTFEVRWICAVWCILLYLLKKYLVNNQLMSS